MYTTCVRIRLCFWTYLRSPISDEIPYSDCMAYGSVFNGRPSCHSLVSFSLLLLRSSVSCERPYYSTINKVFRFQRKTFLLFYCFFFSIIKVFRFQRKTLLFFFSIIIVKVFVFNGRPYCYSLLSFSLLLLGLFDSVEKTSCYSVFLFLWFFFFWT